MSGPTFKPVTFDAGPLEPIARRFYAESTGWHEVSEDVKRCIDRDVTVFGGIPLPLADLEAS